MKTFGVLFTCYFLSIYSSSQTPAFLKAYENKKIISLVESRSETKQKDGTQPSSDNIPMSVTKTKGKTGMWKEVSIQFDKKKNQWLVGTMVKRLQITNETTARTTAYDSENTFERDEMTTVIGSEYDPIIGKVFAVHYNDEGTISDTASVVKGIEKIRRYNLNNILGGEITLLGNILLLKTPHWQVGEQWIDSLKTGSEYVVNNFEIKSIAGKSALIAFKGQISSVPQKPFKPMMSGNLNDAKKAGRIEATNLVETAIHEGEISVDMDTQFIHSITVRKQNNREMTVMGAKTETQGIVETKLTNTVQPIK
jgi:hypothetical protein